MTISELPLVSLAAVFWMSRNALLGRALRDIQKTATRETKLPQTLFQSKDKSHWYENDFLLLMQMKLIFTRKILHLASFLKWE